MCKNLWIFFRPNKNPSTKATSFQNSNKMMAWCIKMPSNMMTAGNRYGGYLNKNQPWFRDAKISSRIFRLNFVWKTAQSWPVNTIHATKNKGWGTSRPLAVLCGLFGMIKWPVWVKVTSNDRGSKSHLVHHLGTQWILRCDRILPRSFCRCLFPLSVWHVEISSLWCAQCFVRKIFSVA